MIRNLSIGRFPACRERFVDMLLRRRAECDEGMKAEKRGFAIAETVSAGTRVSCVVEIRRMRSNNTRRRKHGDGCESLVEESVQNASRFSNREYYSARQSA